VKIRLLLALCSVVLISAAWMNATPQARGEDQDGPLAVCAGEPCDAVARGRLAFLDRQVDGLAGNGRACADCHVPRDQFQLSPETVEARYQLLQLRRQGNPDADDPLFRAIDANDFRTLGAQASDFTNLRRGLIRISFPLPPNIRLVDPATGQVSAETSVDVWRSVPTINDVALTGPDLGPGWMRGPNAFGGYQLDARFGTLQEQAMGALVTHAEVQQLPSDHLLNDLASFQRAQFTNQRIRELADAVRQGAALPDVDPPLNDLEQEGKTVFERACAHCHGGAGQSTPVPPVVRYHDIASQCPRPVDTATPARFAFAACAPQLTQTARTYEITLANGTRVRRSSSDPGRALLTGFVGGPPPQDDWNKFDMPGLRGISRTAPYFHNNSAATLEDVVDHYIEFFKRVQVNAAPGVVPPIATTDGIHFDRRPTVEERAALLAYLQKL
jgi:cytochrome c peroxidase